MGGDTQEDVTGSSEEVSEDVVDVPQDQLIAIGDFENVMYETTGHAEVWLLANGSYELRFSDDFSTTGMLPAPSVAMSVDPEIGPTLIAEDGDLDLGGLPTVTGAQSFALPFAPGPREYAWVWCKPFGIEVARAHLVAP
ncbi:MAG: hypothetical protein KC561_04530 [Myxococcales bacterium]|nr:hypothetical protein [Myxococcales bacterium]